MRSSIVLKGIQLNAQCGVTEAERHSRQPLLVDLIFRCPNQDAFHSDRLLDTVDYGAITKRIQDIAASQTFSLIERMADDICQSLFEEFPISHVKIWVRKISPPLQGIKGSVGIQLSRVRPSGHHTSPFQPAPFLVSHLGQLPSGKVLDVASGKGRHALYLASQGFTVHGIDRDTKALHALGTQAQQENVSGITVETMDLELAQEDPPDLGTELYEVIIVFFYLFRPLFPQFLKALKPGGVILYETFLLDNHIHRQHPRQKEFCLGPNELLTLLKGFHILHYKEGDHEGPSRTDQSFTAQAFAQKTSLA